jgi:hypothetical protein
MHSIANPSDSLDTIAFENAAVDYQLSQYIDEMLPCGTPPFYFMAPMQARRPNRRNKIRSVVHLLLFCVI